MAAPDSKITEIPTECPRCAGQVYDNTKGRGKTNPKSPDARCKDRETCGWAGWLPEQKKAASGANNRPRVAAGPALLKSIKYVKKFIAPEFQNPSNEMIKELAVVLTLAQTKDGCPLSEAPEKPAEPAPTSAPARPAPQPRRAEYDDGYDPSSDLPF